VKEDLEMKEGWKCPECESTENPRWIEYYNAAVVYNTTVDEGGKILRGDFVGVTSMNAEMYTEEYLVCKACGYEEELQ